MGAKILEPEMVDYLLPQLRKEVVQVTSTQRMTAYGRKQQMRSVVIIGDGAGFVGVGVGKAAELFEIVSGNDSKTLIIDEELTSSQANSLSKVTHVEVVDRDNECR